MEENNEFLLKVAKIPKNFYLDTKPFIKWVGGKHSLLKDLRINLPKKYNNYYEPFLGGGALFFDLKPQNSFLWDTNLDLIITYKVVKNKVDSLIKQLKIYKDNHSEKFYYKIRSQHNYVDNDVLVASRFIYLNKTCFNGLYRVNSKGEFNVPMGSYKNPLICDIERLLSTSKILQDINIEYKSYENIEPNKNDFIYFDPPYDDCFTGYSKNKFNINNQQELSFFCRDLDKKGVKFLLSNSDTDDIRKYYKNFNIIEVENIRMISCKANNRGKIKELMIKNY